MTEDNIARAVAYVRDWTAAHPGWHRWSAGDIAAELERDADWATVRLGGWLQTPNGAVITHIVQAALPFPTNLAADVLVEAIQTAARQRTRNRRIGSVAVGIAITALIWTLTNP